MNNLDKMFTATMDEPALVFESRWNLGSTSISNLFLTHFLPRLSNEAVRVYLYLCMSAALPTEGPGEHGVSLIEKIAKSQSLRRDQVMDAMNDLQTIGLLSAKPRYLRDISHLHDWRWERDELYRMETTSALVVETDSVRLSEILEQSAADKKSSDASASCEDGDEAAAIEYQTLITGNYKVAQEILVTIGNKEMRQCELWLSRYGYGPDMVKALLQYCISRGKKDINYASAVAREWYRSNVKTLDDVERYLAQYEETKGRFSRVKKAMGRHDWLTEAEKEMYDRWVGEWEFTEDVILLACRTSTKARNPSFDYVNAVLENWHGAGVKTVEDAQLEMDRSKALRQAGAVKGVNGNRRSGFEGRQPQTQTPARIGSAPRRPDEAKYYADYAKLEEALLDASDEEDVE